MCPPVTCRPPRFNPLLRGLRNAMCVKVYSRVLKAPSLFPEMKFCITCFPGIFHRHQVKPFWQHEFCNGPFTMEHCRRCKKVITTVQPIDDCDECFPMYICVYNILSRTHNISELLVLYFDMYALNLIKLHFISAFSTENPAEDENDNMLEPYM